MRGLRREYRRHRRHVAELFDDAAAVLWRPAESGWDLPLLLSRAFSVALRCAAPAATRLIALGRALRDRAAAPEFTCDWCGKRVAPDPRTFVESGVSLEGLDDDPAEAWKGRAGVGADPGTRARMMREMGLTAGQLDELLSTGEVRTASCICLECQRGEVSQ